MPNTTNALHQPENNKKQLKSAFSRKKKVLKVLLLVTNDIKYDYRILKEAKTLATKYEVKILAFQSNRTKTIEKKDGYTIIRIKEPSLRTIIAKIAPLRAFFIKSSAIPTAIKKRKKTAASEARLLLSDFGLYSYFIAKARRLYNAGKKYKADVYHANDLDTLLAAYMLNKKNKAKLVYDSHELYTEIQSFVKTDYFKKRTAKFEAKYIKKCNAIITVNDEIAEELQKRYKLKRKPHVIMNCPEARKISRKTQKSSAVPTAKLLQNDSSIKIIYQGVLAAGRGLEELILSMKQLQGYTLYMQGFGVEKQKLVTLTKKHNLLNKVIFLNPIEPEKLIEVAQEADIGIVPYKNDCLNYYYLSPNKFFQYMMAGVAIVSSNSKVLSRIIKQNNIGLIIEHYTPQQIAKTLLKLRNTKKLQQYKKNAVALSKKYNWNTEGKKLLEIYGNVVNKKQRT